jgi:hypothetical protein
MRLALLQQTHTAIPCTITATMVRRRFGLVLTRSTQRDVRFSCSGPVSRVLGAAEQVLTPVNLDLHLLQLGFNSPRKVRLLASKLEEHCSRFLRPANGQQESRRLRDEEHPTASFSLVMVQPVDQRT